MEQTLGKRIMQNRKRMGLTQDQLAEKLGVTAQAVSKWENDQSCPDISILPHLAEIFDITTDALLGRNRETVHEAEVVTDTFHEDENEGFHEGENEGFHVSRGGWEFKLEKSKKDALGIAMLVLAIGIQLLAARLLQMDMSFWSTLWPTALLIFGLFGVLPDFSFFRLGCLLFGGYFLLNNWSIFPFTLGGELLFPAILVLFGLSLLVDALKKPNKRHIHIHHSGNDHSKQKNDYETDGETFRYSASFGDTEQYISLPRLTHGEISVSFGDFDVDLSGIDAVSEDCSIAASCSFGELTLLVPRRFTVKPNTSTAFAEISFSGHPDPEPAGVIYLKASASFGDITIRYI